MQFSDELSLPQPFRLRSTLQARAMQAHPLNARLSTLEMNSVTVEHHETVACQMIDHLEKTRHELEFCQHSQVALLNTHIETLGALLRAQAESQHCQFKALRQRIEALENHRHSALSPASSSLSSSPTPDSSPEQGYRYASFKRKCAQDGAAVDALDELCIQSLETRLPVAAEATVSAGATESHKIDSACSLISLAGGLSIDER